ncbi:hypothetical protein SNEBB_007838, partial [Seison nebaliae]
VNNVNNGLDIEKKSKKFFQNK